MTSARSIKPVPLPPVDHPMLPPLYIVAAMKALANGRADERQQVAVYEWIIKVASNIGGQSYRGGDSYATAFMEGRRFVGAQMIAVQALDEQALRKATNNG